MSNNLIELKNIDFTYPRSKQVFSNLNFTLTEGERIALLGCNGAGKTTLLKLIVGLLKPDNGEVFAFGKERKSEKEFFEVRSKTGFLFQDSEDQLFCSTVAEDVAFGPFNLGKSRDEVNNIVQSTLKSLDLEGYENRITYKLSGGEKRLVALGTVLAMEPDVLLLDEPTTGLDDKYRKDLINILNSVDKSMIVISHDQEFLTQVTSTSKSVQ